MNAASQKMKPQDQVPVTFSHLDEGQMSLLRCLNDLCQAEGINRANFIRIAIKRELLARGAIQA